MRREMYKYATFTYKKFKLDVRVDLIGGLWFTIEDISKLINKNTDVVYESLWHILIKHINDEGYENQRYEDENGNFSLLYSLTVVLEFEDQFKSERFLAFKKWAKSIPQNYWFLGLTQSQMCDKIEEMLHDLEKDLEALEKEYGIIEKQLDKDLSKKES